MPHEPETERILSETLEAHGLDAETVLYRATLEDFLELDESSGGWWMSANPDPSEAVVDVYGGGYGTVASQVGPGVAFALRPDSQWRDQGRVTVAVRLGDVLDQDGLLYPVESVITEPVWYVTLPAGRVRVDRV
ncbi:MAG: hypothetical protein JSU98_01980 [Gemmatimonadales bacterium]|jgi:hypothetical protein|nr:MAG: hypothetical protein JSU98_01980 [Gemmatimonadales bacterium]